LRLIGIDLAVIAQCLKGRTRAAAAVLQRSTSAVDVDFIIPEPEIHCEHKDPEQGQKRNHGQIGGALVRDQDRLCVQIGIYTVFYETLSFGVCWLAKGCLARSIRRLARA
jgi:hypothetical protein